MPEPIDYLIVGGGVAGSHAVFEIRKHDKSGTILVVNEEDQFPYDRPPLSKEYLAGKKKRRELFFRADSYYSRKKVEVLREHRVKSIDASHRNITLDDGREISYKSLLLATGGRVRKLEVPGSDLEGIYYLRTLQNCDVIRKAASNSRKVAIVGGGFIGCEVAATLRSKGLKVTLIEISSHLLSAAIDEETADWIREYHSKKGVDVLTNASVSGFIGKNGRVNGVELKDGKVIPAEFVVVGIGIIPNTELAENARLKVDKGLIVDEYLKTSVHNIYMPRAILQDSTARFSNDT
jgi:3-phenylpropionate/trans-cinnamate dioxygenase ferredoxin reductase component